MRIQSVMFTFGFIGCTPVTQVRAPGSTSSSVPECSSPSTGRMVVTTGRTCPTGHDCNIVEVLDVHTDATSEDKGFDELRTRAARVGADAVIGAEFEHGDNGGPSHLSGMIVRYGQPVPPHVEIGQLDIPSEETAQDKGLATLSARGHEMGGDQVIDVTFEHGDDGALGHLRGKVIRFTP